MKRLFLLAPLCLALAVGAYGWLTRADPSPGAAPPVHGAPATASRIVRGAYLARAADCVACHTTPGGKPFAGGLAFKLPFGTLYSSNITADPQTGIGAWSDDDFVRALHDGVRKDGKRLYPAFPYTAYSLLSREDALAIKAYLSSLPAVRQATPPPDLAFPFDQRWAMGVWNAAFFKSARFVPAPDRSAEWNTGAYLATALAHCAECHTPRNTGFALDRGRELAGAVVEGWRAPNITAHALDGVGGWSDAALYQYLRLGHAPGHGAAGGPMGEAVENSLQYLDPRDTRALVAYLRGVPARSGDAPVMVDPRPASVAAAQPFAPPAGTPAALREGLRLFEGRCASCHGWNGQGLQTPYAALAGARSVNDPSGRNVVQTLLHGAHLRVAGQDVYMPRFDALDDAEIAQLSNYVIHQFGGKRGTVTPALVAAQRRE